MDECKIPLRLIGYNEKGLIGFMLGGNHLSYLDDIDNTEEAGKAMNLPYISDETVKEVNAYDSEGNRGKD